VVLEEGLEEAFALEELSDLVEETFEVGPWASLSSVQMIGVPSAVMGTSLSVMLDSVLSSSADMTAKRLWIGTVHRLPRR
jgi:hypothetical protein